MTFRVLIRRAAEQDFLKAQLWYADIKPGLAVDFHDEVSRVIDRLIQSPSIYQQVYGNVRRAVMRKFPYLIWYVVEDDTVIVLGCSHSHSDPSRVAERLDG